MAPRDTLLDARRVQLAVYARLGPSRRAALGYELSELARSVAIEGIRARSPGLSAEAARRVLLRRLLGDDLFEAAYGRRASA
jgi:hypothetical protein